MRQDPPAAPLELGQADVRGDRVQPRPGRAPLAQPGRAAPGAHQRLLERVVGVVHRAEHAVAVRVELGPVRSTRSAKSRISLRALAAQRLLHHHQRVAGRVTEPEHRRHRVAHPRHLGVDVDTERLHLGVGGVDVVGGQGDAGLRRLDLALSGGGGASAIPVVPSGG